MSEYESVLANQILGTFRTKMKLVDLEVLPVNNQDTYVLVSRHLHTDSRASLVAQNDRKEVQLGIETGDNLGRSQMIAVFDQKMPVAVFTFVVEAPVNIRKLGYVRSGDKTNKRYSFENIYGLSPNYLVVPAFTEVLPDYRSKIRQVGFEAMSQSLDILGSSFSDGIMEIVAQGNDRDIGVVRRESASVVKWADRLGMKQKVGIGAIPSLGPVFYRYCST